MDQRFAERESPVTYQPILMRCLPAYQALVPVLLLAAAVSLGSYAAWAQTNKGSGEFEQGDGTNAFRAEIEILYPDASRGPQAVVYVSHTGCPSAVASNLLAGVTDANLYDRLRKNEWPYFMARNSSCGRIELHDAAGQAMPLLKPESYSPTNYPETYSLEIVHSNYFRQFQFYSGPRVFPVPLFVNRQRSEIARFALSDYFTVPAPGKYTLSVWPVIYTRIATTNDLCRRIDLPPVSAVIQGR